MRRRRRPFPRRYQRPPRPQSPESEELEAYGYPPELGYYAAPPPEFSGYGVPPDVAYYADPASIYAGYGAYGAEGDYGAYPDYGEFGGDAGYAEYGEGGEYGSPYGDPCGGMGSPPPELTGWDGYGWYGADDPAVSGYESGPVADGWGAYAEGAGAPPGPDVAAYGAPDYSGYIPQGADNFDASCCPPPCFHGAPGTPMEGYIEPRPVHPVVDQFRPPPPPTPACSEVFRPPW